MHIDWWTLALQTVNVLILIWLLTRFFFRPVAAIVAERQRQASGLLSDAAAARKAADTAQAEIGQLRAEVDAERAQLAADAQKNERIAHDDMLAKSREEIAKLRADAAAAIARDRATAETAVIAHAAALAIDIARKLLERLPRGLALSVFTGGLCARLRDLPDDMRRVLASASSRQPLEIVTDAALADPEKEQVGATLAEALGGTPAITFRFDADVLAGIELHGGNTVVSNSWRADLDRIRGELSHEQPQSEA
jgi:F-type H+-transporting ATPase subunit b